MKRIILALLLTVFALPAFAATCKISEYGYLVQDGTGQIVPVAAEPALDTQEITYTTTAASAAFNAQTRFIRVICDAKAHFVVAATPTADATDPYLAADTAEYFGIAFNVSMKIAFYDGSS